MSFEADYRAALVANAPLNAVVSGRIGVRLGQAADFPAIRFQRISTARLYVQTGRVSLCQARVQNDCWSVSNTGALDLADLLIQAIDTLTLGGPGKPNFILNQWFDSEPEPEPVMYRVIVEAKIFFIDSA